MGAAVIHFKPDTALKFKLFDTYEFIDASYFDQLGHSACLEFKCQYERRTNLIPCRGIEKWHSIINAISFPPKSNCFRLPQFAQFHAYHQLKHSSGMRVIIAWKKLGRQLTIERIHSAPCAATHTHTQNIHVAYNPLAYQTPAYNAHMQIHTHNWRSQIHAPRGETL